MAWVRCVLLLWGVSGCVSALDSTSSTPLTQVERLEEVEAGENKARVAVVPHTVPSAPQALSTPSIAQRMWGALRGAEAGAALPEDAVVWGTRPKFGVVAPVCHYSKKDLGTLVGQYPDKRPQYRLYDSDTTAERARAFYITGFADGCLRQVTAAQVVFGTVQMHEQLRYGLPSDLYPYTGTDKAYEGLKRRICKVARKTPCAGPQKDVLMKTAVFLSVYNAGFDGGDWASLLIHDGRLLASHVVAQ